ncbi:lipopolysaccharide biosynthesis protein [Flindersiella endophytica]
MVTTADPVARVVRNGTILILGRLVSLAAGVVTLPVLFRGLGAHTFGVWVLLSGLAGILGYFDLGLGSALIREVAQGTEPARRRRARAVQMMCALWGLGFGGLAFAVGTVSWPLVASLLPQPGLGVDRLAIALILLSSWIGGMALPWRAVLEGTQRYFALAGIECGAALLTAAISIRIAVAGGGPTGLAAGAASVAVIRTVVVVCVAHSEVPALTPSLRLLRWSDVSGTLRYGLRVQATRLATVVNLEADGIVLGAYFGPATAAAYEPGRRVANLFRLPVSLVTAAAFPVVARVAASGSRHRLDKIYLHMTRYLATFAAVGGAALVVCADPLIRLWIGEPVPLAAVTLAILAAGSVVNLAVHAASVLTCAEGEPGRETRYAFFTTGLNLLLTYPCLKLAGPVGVPLSTAVAAAVASTYFVVHVQRRSGRPAWPAVRILIPPCAAALAATSLTFALAGTLPDGPGRAGAALAVGCRGALATVLVVTALVAVRYVDATELRRLRTVLGSRRRRSQAMR